jgi:hypothetical protein
MSFWSDAGMGTVVIAAASPVEIDAFTMITAADPELAPMRWYLEGSEDAYNWHILHEQAEYDATVPTTPFSQYLIYPFNPREMPYQNKNIFEKSIIDFQKTCMDADIIQEIDTELSSVSPPVFFNPTSSTFDEKTNTCTYYQGHENTVMEVALETNVVGQTSVQSIKRKKAPERKQRRTKAAVTGAPMAAPPSSFYESPLSVPGFGSDRIRNTVATAHTGVAEYTLQDAYGMPLQQDGSAYYSHAIEGTVLGNSAGAVVVYTNAGSPMPAFKYIRFRTIKTRNPNAPVVRLSKFSLWYNTSKLYIGGAVASNPMGTWKGSIRDVTEEGGGWEDKAKQPLVLAFSSPVHVNGFSWSIPIQKDRSVACDPVRWKVEGSSNGVYWTTLHDQSRSDYETPVHPGWPLPIFMFDGSSPRPRPNRS